MTTPNSLPFPPSPDDGDVVIRNDMLGVYHKDINTWAIMRLTSSPDLKLNTVENWSDKDWKQGSLVISGGQEYYAVTDIKTGDPAPGAPGSSWKNVSVVRKIEDLTDVDPSLPRTAGHILIWNGTRYVPGPIVTKVLSATSNQVFNQLGATTSDKLNAVYPLLNKVPGEAPGSGAVIIVTHVDALHQALEGAWYFDGTKWLQGGGAGGGGGATTEQNFRAAESTAQKPGALAGDLDIVTEALKHQINVFDGANWQEVLKETTIKQWIAAGSLFQGTRTGLAGTGDTLANLPTPGPTNKGFYWTWTGAANTSVTPTDFPAGGFTATLQVGDWIQSDGTKLVHVPSDLLSKLRWNSLGSFQPWSDTNWESNSLVVDNGKFYRASAAITTGGIAPGAAGSLWTDITPVPALGGLTDVDLSTASPVDGEVLVYDQLNNNWHNVQLALNDLSDVNADVTDPASDGAVFQWDLATQQWVAGNRLILRLEDLGDTGQLGGAAAGQVPFWDATTNEWKPLTLPAGKFLGSLATPPLTGNTSEVFYQNVAGTFPVGATTPVPYVVGMNPVLQAGAEPDPANPGQPLRNTGGVVALTAGWIFSFNGTNYSVNNTAKLIARINAGETSPTQWAVGVTPPITAVTGSTATFAVGFYQWNGTAWSPIANSLSSLSDTAALATATDGQMATWDAANKRWIPTHAPNELNDLDDVRLSALADGQVLKFDLTANEWHNSTVDSYTKAQIDTKISTLVVGFAHGVAAQSIVQDPPTAPVADELYIVGTLPTGLFATHANELAVWDGTKWVFSVAQPNEAHLVEDQSATYGWSGTAWVKVASAVSGGTSAQAGVGEIVPWIGNTFPTTDYLECKGQVIAIPTYSDLHNAIGNKYNPGTAADGTSTFALPDLRGYFLRGDKTGLTAGTAHPWTTGLPKTAFGTTSDGSHSHSFKRSNNNFSGDGKYRDAQLSTIDASGGGSAVGGGIVSGGAHSHAVTGGDAETAPDHFVVKWLIRYKPINGGATGAAGPKGDATPLGEVWQVGSIQQSMLTETQWATLLGPTEGAKWVLADGRNCAGTKYAQITGKTNLPDLRGAFLRSAGQNNNKSTKWNGGDVGQWFEDSTALPKTAFTTSNPGNHDHGGMAGLNVICQDIGGHDLNPNAGGNREGIRNFQAAGGHTHTIGGGDAQTAPVHVAVNVFIKIN
jgi:microcystin-dependent protein